MLNEKVVVSKGLVPCSLNNVVVPQPKVIRYQAGTRSGFPKLIAEKLMHNLDLVIASTHDGSHYSCQVYSEASTDKPPQSNCKVLIVDR